MTNSADFDFLAMLNAQDERDFQDRVSGTESMTVCFAGIAYHVSHALLQAELVEQFPNDRDVADRRKWIDGDTSQALTLYRRLAAVIREGKPVDFPYGFSPEIRKAARQLSYALDAYRIRAGMRPAEIERIAYS